jgi:N-acetyl-alpha-D-glucosaminyl L-malate synthase BshA
MKIGIVCYPTYGGSGVVATELGKSMASVGHEVHFITYQIPTRLEFLAENIFFHSVSVPEYPLFEHRPYEIALASRIVDVALNEKLDLLHVHYAIPHASAAFMAQKILKEKNFDLPFITTLHGTDITLVGKDESFAPVVEYCINHSDGVTAVSQSLKRDTIGHFNISREIEVIHNFIDLNRFRKLPREHFRRAICHGDSKILIHVSNFRKVKRIDDAIRIFAEVRKKIQSKLLLIGDGPERRKTEILCAELGISEEVRFMGKIEAVEEILSIGDLFLMPSDKESFGLAALEAMACEVPVVSSNAGGLPELVTHGISGFLADVGDYHQMARYALQVLDDAHLPKFKQEALKRAKEFDINTIRPKYEDYYQSVLNKS